MTTNFYFLMLGYTITMLGSKIGALAQMFKSFEISNAVYGISTLLLLKMISSIVINPISFKILNKYSYKKIIITSEILNGIVTFGIFIFSNNLYLLIILATFSCFLNSIYRPAFFSLIPTIVAQENVNKANSILSSLDSLIAFLGYSISGVFIFYLGGDLTFLIDAFSYFFSVPLYFFIKIPLAINKSTNTKKCHYFKFFKENLKTINFLNINFIVWTVCGLFSALEIPFLKNVLNFNDKFIGNFFSIVALGNILGAFISSKYLKTVKNIRKIYIITSFLIILKPIVFITITYKISFIILGLISGVLLVLLKNSANMFIFSQDRELQSKYFNHLFLINHIGMGIGLILATLLGDKFSYSSLLISISTLSLVILFCYFFNLKFFKNK